MARIPKAFLHMDKIIYPKATSQYKTFSAHVTEISPDAIGRFFFNG